MADIGTVLGAAQTLFAALECSVLKEVCSALGYKSQLEDLKSTVETVKSVLLDAAASEELTHTARDYIEKLKTAVYDADDLFDEFRTVAERKHQKFKEGSKLLDKVRFFFSSNNSLKVAYTMSREIKKIRKSLDVIARDHANFGFSVDSKRIRNRREETCSYVNAPNVIGRESDVESIINKLLGLGGDKAAPFLTVVGIGGMGKTTLAQLVCDDKRVKENFSSKVWWVCVADQDSNEFDKKRILSRILDLATDSKHHDLSLEEVQIKLSRQLAENKYLIVLDDLWNENKVKWMEMKEFLTLGATESRILVTTRSLNVAKVIGHGHIHVLKGLSDENSWRLFEMTAFEATLEEFANPLEVEIGKKIVKQCSNVPLAIKVVGSLLCGQGLDKWQSIEKSGLGGIGKGDNQIMSILKFSYNHLDSSLKTCFTFCALFPKDHEIKKKMLIRHWMAHGYIVPFDRGQSIEDAGEEHFLILLRRSFFQDVKTDQHGHILSFKMHDLIHDVAQEVAGQEMLVATTETSYLGVKARHVFGGTYKCEDNFYSNVKVRSFLRVQPFFKPSQRRPLNPVFPNGGCLRTLTLVNVGMKTLPNSIGKLLHLRLLDLSHNGLLETLPGSITKLHNLQTLNLYSCQSLGELPKDFSRLVNLMHLNIKCCWKIKYMPLGMDKLTSLCELTNFIVADDSSSQGKPVGQLKDLKTLVNLKGRIEIEIQDNFTRADLYDWEGSCFEGAKHLQEVQICFPYVRDADSAANHEALMEKLLPHPNVNYLFLGNYMGVKVPRWGRADYKWVNLVNIDIKWCQRLRHLGSLSKLNYLKSLSLFCLPEFEYMEETSCSIKYASACTLFPSLESVVIYDVPKLKGIWAGVEFADYSSNARLWQRSFPRLCNLRIDCDGDNIPSFREISLDEFKVSVSKVDILKSLPAARLTKIRLCDKEVQSLAEVGDVFNNCSSLRSLALYKCSKLSHLSGAWEHLTKLESLRIYGCTALKWEEGGDEDGMPWRHLHHNLRSLKLVKVSNLEVLKGMKYLTSLQKLCIADCENLKALPEWISCFPSLLSLTIKSCKEIKSIPEWMKNMRSLAVLVIMYGVSDELKERCQELDGEDWPNIQHIPYLYIS